MKTDVTPPALLAYRPAGSASGSGFARRMGRVMKRRRWVLSGAAVFLLVAGWRGIGAGQTPEAIPSPRGAVAPSGRTAVRSLVPQGVGSCAATACHGGVSTGLYPSRVLRNEHTTWITQDDHANAYLVLLSPRSKAIAQKLSGGRTKAHEDARCLTCHATSTAGLSATAAGQIVQDGVGCESCHGPAERWLAEHTRSDWAYMTPREKETHYGMRSTRNLTDRVAICVECHVGAPGRDMNHDLIAAGHPRLNFEFAAYLANMPPHWIEDTQGNFPAQAWAIGQAVTARAALTLLESRARKAEGSQGEKRASAPWPEFSEYDCFACHHDLADEAWRKERGGSSRQPGTPAWGTWYYPMALALAGSDRRPEVRALASRFAPLRTAMERFGPEPGTVAGEAHALAESLSQWLGTLSQESRTFDAAKVKGLIDTVQKRDKPGDAPGWDGAAQRYLALQPLRLSVKGLDPAWKDAPLETELKQLFEKLHFPRGFDSPRRFNPAQSLGDR
jgi:hypothetical protein